MDIRDLLHGVYDGSVFLPAAVPCPHCGKTAVLYPVSAPFPWLYCSNCDATGYLRRASAVVRPRTDYRPATPDDISKIVLFVKHLCGITCNTAEAQRLLPFFVRVVHDRCKHVALALEDAPGRCVSTLSLLRKCSLSLILRSAEKNARIPFDPGVMLATRLFRQQQLHATPLFLFPLVDAVRLHAEHARMCDCVLPVASIPMPTYFKDVYKWCASVCSILNIIAVRRRVVCVKAKSLQEVPPNLFRLARRIGARVFVYDELPIVPDVHKLLHGITKAAWSVSYREQTQFVGPDSRIKALSLYGDYGVLQLASRSRPLLRHGDMWYRVDSLEPIMDCDVRLQEIILPDGIYKYVIRFGEQQVVAEVKANEHIIPAIMRAFEGHPYVPIIEADDRLVKRIALVAGHTKVSWRN